MSYRPHMRTKVRSKRIMNAPKTYREEKGECMPCTLRVAGFLGQPCADYLTCVMNHVDDKTKGMSTKTSDVEAVCGCQRCHDLLDRRGNDGIALREQYAAAVEHRIREAGAETRAMLIDLGILTITDGELL